MRFSLNSLDHDLLGIGDLEPICHRCKDVDLLIQNSAHLLAAKCYVGVPRFVCMWQIIFWGVLCDFKLQLTLHSDANWFHFDLTSLLL